MNKIYVVTHKNVSCKFDNLYVPLVVGANHNRIDMENRDNTGDNISDKNADFCELTGQYWIWKNSKADVVGLNHYRRFFYKNGKRLNAIQLKRLLEKYDVIIADKFYLKSTIKEIYASSELNDYLQECVAILQEKYPEYANTFFEVLLNNYTFPYNMFVCRKNVCDAYSEWLFDILFLLEQRIADNNLKHVPRAYGYISENLLITWIITNHLNYCVLPVFNTEENFMKQRVRYAINKMLKRKVL